MGAGGDSKGMVEFLSQKMVQLAQDRPFVAFKVESKRGPPSILATYTNGYTKTFQVSRKPAEDILKKTVYLLDSRGKRDVKMTSPVRPHKMASMPVVPLWNPFTAKTIFKP